MNFVQSAVLVAPDAPTHWWGLVVGVVVVGFAAWVAGATPGPRRTAARR